MKNNILVINCGSSSLKFSLITPSSGETLVSGLAERLLTNEAQLTIKHNEQKQTANIPSPFDHQKAIEAVVVFLKEQSLTEQIFAVGHRVVHGGEKYSQPTLIDDDVKNNIDELAKLAPLHNPANLQGVLAAEAVFGRIPQVAIFDTAFHQTMPAKAYLYALPYQLYQTHGIRKYGFHGTSHYFVAKSAAALINKTLAESNFISAHLGNGCSITAVKQGKSVDTSLGLTPLEGLMMGTRSGSVDPGIIFHLVDQLGYSLEQVNTLLNKESGLLGVSQLSNDCRELEQAAEQGHQLAQLALDIFCYRIAKTIASFSVCFTSLDGIIFTGGIGENSSHIRSKVLSQLSLLNCAVDNKANITCRFGQSGNIAPTDALPCWVIPTNEEWVIAEQSYQLLNGAK
ncbi:acetate kinase [Thalassotalea sp. G2M2-11]|uniref:acetate kinase n=1 Tax=Thalassotalea sp. G2M2-11 TaxID=2787627 RepID=UPI0019D1BC4B|nr:acetate kinase [Thalassotalea sp. G2M2-11]